MTAITTERQRVGSERLLHAGSVLVSFGAVAFVGFAVIFFVLNFANLFLELGIGRAQVDVDKNQIQDFSPRPPPLHISHLHIAVAGFIAAAGIAALFLTWFRRPAQAALGLGRRSRRARRRARRRTSGALPVGSGHDRPPGADRPGDRDLRGRRAARAEGADREAELTDQRSERSIMTKNRVAAQASSGARVGGQRGAIWLEDAPVWESALPQPASAGLPGGGSGAPGRGSYSGCSAWRMAKFPTLRPTLTPVSIAKRK